MANRPKDIGTATETAVVRYLRENGFPQAERRALHGNVDLGDITGTPGIVWEVKGGKAAESASDAQIEAWLAETETERRNADEELGVLVTKRKAVGSTRVGNWWAWMWLAVGSDKCMTLDAEAAAINYGETPTVVVRLTFAEAVRLVRFWGYGDEPTEAFA